MANAEFSEQEQIRRESLAKLRELGIEPYPAAEYPVNTTTAEITAGYDPQKNNFILSKLQTKIFDFFIIQYFNIVIITPPQCQYNFINSIYNYYIFVYFSREIITFLV